MQTLVRGLVFCNALLLALPAGWCCTLPSGGCDRPRDAAEQAAELAKPKCCHSRAVAPRSSLPVEPASGPVKPCCQSADAVVAPMFKQFQGSAASAIMPLPVVSILWSAPVAERTPSGSTFPTLSLQVLHCVWLC
jgi:hypothetical protein